MIVVTRLNNTRFAVNPDLVERIHEVPDTTLVMVDGAKYVVTEPMAEVIEMIARYRARIVSLAYDADATGPAGGPGASGRGNGNGNGNGNGPGSGRGPVHFTGPVALDPVALHPAGRA